MDLLQNVRDEKRFDGLYPHRSGDISKVLEQREEAFLEYWNAWDTASSPTAAFRDAQEVAVRLVVATDSPEDTKFDFFLVHVLTSSHAVRILLPLVPAKFHVSLLRQWWLFTLAVYIAQTRPAFHEFEPVIQLRDRRGRKEWKYVVAKALNGEHAKDAHYVKGVLQLKFSVQLCTSLQDPY